MNTVQTIYISIAIDQSGNYGNDGLYVDECYIDEVVVPEFSSFVPILILFLGDIIIILIWLLSKIRK